MEFWCSDEIDAGGGQETGNLFGVALPIILSRNSFYFNHRYYTLRYRIGSSVRALITHCVFS